MGADIYSTMGEMLIEFCTKYYGKMERGRINRARDGGRIREGFI
jgi:hypothetical protein